MKNKLWTLYKATTINNYNTNKRFGGKNTGKTIRGGILTVLIMLSILALSGLYSYLLMSYLHPQGLGKYVLLVFSIVAVVASFMLTINRAKSMLFDSKDNDLLFAMPIKFGTILSNRVLNLLTINYVTTAAIFLPTLVIYAIFVPVNLMFFLVGIIAFLLLPLIPTVLASIIGYLIAFSTSKFGGGKIVEVIFTFAFFVLVMFASMQIQTIAINAISHLGSIDLFITKYLFVLDWMIQALVNTNMLSLLYYILVNIGVFAIFVLILAKGYSKVISKLKETKTSKKHGEVKYASGSVQKALIKKEFSKLVSTPIYLLNSTFGVVLLVVVTIATVFTGSDALEKIMGFENMGAYLPMLVMGIMGFLVLMSNTTLCSISLEGQNFWIIKSLPVTEKQVLNSKIMLNMLVVLPISIICVVILGIVLSLGVINTILLLIYVIALAIFVPYFGILVNLKFPKLKFASEVQAIKQSMSSFVGIFVPMILFFILAAVIGIISSFVSIRIIILMVIAVLLLAIVIERAILNTWGVKKFKELN